MEPQKSSTFTLSFLGRTLGYLLLAVIVFGTCYYVAYKWGEFKENRPWSQAQVETRVASILEENKVQQGAGDLVVKMTSKGNKKWQGTAQRGAYLYSVSFDESSPNVVTYSRLEK